MPFKSRAQLRTCFGRHDPRWNCKKWLTETPSLCCLPERVGDPLKCRSQRRGEKVIGPVKEGPRGGKFFEIEERDAKGTICKVKVYLSRGRRQSS